MMKQKKIYKNAVIILMIVALIVMLGLSIAAFFAGRASVKPDVQTKSKTTHLSFKDIGKLVTQEAYVTRVGCISTDRKFFGTDVKIPFTDTVCIFSLDFQITASYDFANVVPNITEPTEDGQKGIIEISLPEPEVNTATKSSSEEVYFDKESLFTDISEENKAQARAEMEAAAEKEAIENGLLTNARSNAEKLLINFIHNLYGEDEYEIKFVND